CDVWGLLSIPAHIFVVSPVVVVGSVFLPDVVGWGSYDEVNAVFWQSRHCDNAVAVTDFPDRRRTSVSRKHANIIVNSRVAVKGRRTGCMVHSRSVPVVLCYDVNRCGRSRRKTRRTLFCRPP